MIFIDVSLYDVAGQSKKMRASEITRSKQQSNKAADDNDGETSLTRGL